MGPEQRVINVLREDQVLSKQSLDEALARQAIFGGDLVSHLLERPELTPQELLSLLGKAWNLPTQQPGELDFSAERSRALMNIGFQAIAQMNSSGLAVIVSTPPSDEQRKVLSQLIGEHFLSIALPSQLKKALLQTELIQAEDEPVAAKPQVIAEAHLITQTQVNPTFSTSQPEVSLAEQAGTPHPWSDQGATAPPPENYALLAQEPAKKVTEELSTRAALPSITLDEVCKQLQQAEERTEIADSILRYAGSIFKYSALFTIAQNELRGLTSIGTSDDSIDSIRFPLDLKSQLKAVCDSKKYRIVRLKASGLEGALSRDLHRPSGQNIFLWPILLRERVVLLLWGDQGKSDVDISQLGELSLLAEDIALALERVLLKRKRTNRISQSLTPSLRPLDWKSTAQSIQDIGSLPPLRDELNQPRNWEAHGDEDELEPETIVESSPHGQRDPALTRVTNFDASVPKAAAALSQQNSQDSLEPSPVSRFDKPQHQNEKTLNSNTHELSSAEGREKETELQRSAKGSELRAPSSISSAQVVSFDQEEKSTDRGAAKPQILTEPDAKGTLVSKYSRSELPPDDGWQSPLPTATKAKSVPRRVDYDAVVDELIENRLNALQKLRDGGEAAIGALVMRFPGPVDESFSSNEHPAQAGPLFAALIEFGQQAVPFITVRTADESETIRRFATLVLSKIPCQESARAISRRLHDNAESVRVAAEISAQRLMSDKLAARALSAQLEQMARDPQSTLQERKRAIETLAQLGRIEAIPTLLRIFENNPGELKVSVLLALTQLTCHDYGDKLSSWQEFWQNNRNRSRASWLIDALLHAELEVRTRACDTLRPLVHSLHGYHPQATEQERILAVELLHHDQNEP